VLSQIQAFDEALLEGVPALDEKILALEQAAPEQIPAASDGVLDVVQHLSTQFDARSSVIETATPSSVVPAAPPISSALDKQDSPQAPPAYNLHDRDAVSILGDNGIVDARIDIAGTNPIRLFRLEGDPRRWLLVPATPGKDFALLTETASPVKVSTTTLDGVEYTSAAPQNGVGSAIGSGGEEKGIPIVFVELNGVSDPNARALLIDWGRERQAFTGRAVNPKDVELYGSTLQ